MRPEPVCHIPYDAGTPEGRPKHPSHPQSAEARGRSLELIREFLRILDEEEILDDGPRVFPEPYTRRGEQDE